MSYLFDYVYHGESLKPSDRATAKQNKVSSNSHSSKVDASVSSQHSKVTSAVSEPHRVRRASVAVSVAAFIQKRTTVSVSELEDAESASRKHAPLINSKSESHIAKKADLTRRDSWKVALFVAKAKRKFSAEGDKLLTRRPSLSNYVKVAMLKRPEGNTRNILREMKRKAFVQKVTVYFLLFIYFIYL
ncbi:hypothetical protein DPMN_000487 [Dreissena polymorpha]|uniref:Uncharacterized protein n=1 Tax=Dreissena polymorpha TaxID=45954 RepID=A0A9D4MJ33_DREPO|nr:hypothetical protein DPMN_000487 [Dreissena polymorpha]